MRDYRGPATLERLDGEVIGEIVVSVAVRRRRGLDEITCRVLDWQNVDDWPLHQSGERVRLRFEDESSTFWVQDPDTLMYSRAD